MDHFIAKTIIDLRREPVKPAIPLIEDPLQETQLLPGESVNVIETRGPWAFVEALEQPCFKSEWSGYKGWVEISGLMEKGLEPNLIVGEHGVNVGSQVLPIGSKLVIKEETSTNFITDKGAISKNACLRSDQSISDPRQFVIEKASSFIGMPYQWGGRSSYLPKHYLISSVDCSGLVNLVFLLMGRVIPRDAHDQWLKAKPLEPNELKPGDLIFTAKASRPDRITHVMIYKNINSLIEAASAEARVHEVPITEKLGLPVGVLKNGIQLPDKVIFFGSLL